MGKCYTHQTTYLPLLIKAQDLPADRDTYKHISGEPTARLKNKLIQTFRNIKRHGGLNDYTYKMICPTSAVKWTPQNS